jgi:hypothetical protein
MKTQLKAGETLSWTVTDDSGDLTGTTIEAAIAGTNFYYPLTVTEDDLSLGIYTLSATSTATFPVGTLYCDIKYTTGGIVVYSNTFEVKVIAKVTA